MRRSFVQRARSSTSPPISEVIKKALQQKNFSQATHILESSPRQKLSSECFMQVASAAIASKKDIRFVEDIFRRMQHASFTPNHRDYTTILSTFLS